MEGGLEDGLIFGRGGFEVEFDSCGEELELDLRIFVDERGKESLEERGRIGDFGRVFTQQPDQGGTGIGSVQLVDGRTKRGEDGEVGCVLAEYVLQE